MSLLLALPAAGTAFGATVIYPGTATLQTDPLGTPNSLFPGTTASPLASGNIVFIAGGTGVGEIGLTLKPIVKKLDLSFDIGLQGYVGQRQGGTGSLQARVNF